MIAFHSVLALSVDSGGILAGVIINSFLDIRRIPWIILIYGSLLAARGDIGILAGKLSTTLQLGTVKPTFKNNTPLFKNIVVSILNVATVDAVAIGCLTYISNLFLFPKEVSVLNPTLFFVTPFLVLYVTALLSIIITTTFSFFLFKRKLQLDIYIIPTMNTLNNILMTLIYVGIIFLLQPWGKDLQYHSSYGEFYPPPQNADLLFTYLAIIPFIVFLGTTIYFITKRLPDKSFTKIIKESTPMILLGMLCGIFTGMLLTKLELILITYPQLLIALPALICLMEDQSTSTGNSLTTDFAAKGLEPSFKAIRQPVVWLRFLAVGTTGVIITSVIIIIGILIKINTYNFTAALVILLLVIILASIISYAFIILIMFMLIVFSYKKEVDPDNYLIAFFSSFADFVFVGVVLLLPMIFL